MKKHALALAIASAVAVPAMAQNVSIYGAVDYGFQNYDNGATTYTRTVNGPLRTSRIGFTGSEDLGGGLKANFRLQGTLAAGVNAAAQASTTAAGSNFGFDEEAYVGLSGAFGEVRIGRTDVTNVESIDTTVSQMGNLGNTVGLASTTAATGTDFGGNAANTIRYISPVFGGVNVDLGYTTKNSAGAVTDTDTPVTSIGFKYVNGAFSLHGGFTEEKAAAGGTERDQKVIAAAYTGAPISVGLYMSWADVSASANANADTKTTILTAAMPIGNGLTAHAGLFRAKIEDSAVKGSGYTLALTKTLSKRTTVYGAYSAADSDDGSYFKITGTDAPTAAGGNTSAITVGVSHAF